MLSLSGGGAFDFNYSLRTNCLAKSLEVTEIPKTELYETGVPSISDHSVKFSVTKSPLNSPTHISKEFSPEVTFELQLSPEIKFNVSEVDLENESLNEVDFSENSKADEQNENERVFETISVKDDINTPKTISQCQYSFSNVDPQNLDLNNSGCDGNLMQSLLNSIDTGTTSTEYKALCEEFTARQNFDYQSALNEKDEFIQTLTKSLQESMEVQKELNKDVSNLHNELDQLRTKLAEVEKS
ncbi:uncharacterized protein LOC113382186 [Ctenocephalides felis]|uniref:uncharacterized protein LOC113382186 n=1 Tax=Ctenocephalides felis TaxID=7515 RepID=UPI000E6E1E3C|nr:uncharacterized protein LOC113382186 [Ctenocephalides felis]